MIRCFLGEEELMTATIQWAVLNCVSARPAQNDDVIFYLSIRSPSHHFVSTPLIASTTPAVHTTRPFL